MSIARTLIAAVAAAASLMAQIPAPPAPPAAPAAPAPAAVPASPAAPLPGDFDFNFDFDFDFDFQVPPIPPLPPIPPVPNFQFEFQMPPAPPMPPTPPGFPVDFQFAYQDTGKAVSDAVRRGVDETVRESIRAAQEAARAASRINNTGNDYRQGQQALDRRQYDQAINRFDRVIERKGDRPDGAMYWKAYALNKLGRRDDALATLAEMEKLYPQSRWLMDARALTAEVRTATGQGVSPESQTDEDIKLFAINSLINQDPDRAIPLLERVLNEPRNPPSLKSRAMYVLAQSRAPKAREIVTQYAKGGANPDLQLRAVEYLGTVRSTETTQTLGEIYSSSSDKTVKRAALSSLSAARAKDRILAIARAEQDADLRREAIQHLAGMQAGTELADMYNAESSVDIKEIIIRSMPNNSDRLMEIAKNEKEPRLRRAAIQRVGTIRSNVAGDTLTAMYSSETDKQIKRDIIRSLAVQGSSKQLVDLARKETDLEMKRELVRQLSNTNSKEATDYLQELLTK